MNGALLSHIRIRISQSQKGFASVHIIKPYKQINEYNSVICQYIEITPVGMEKSGHKTREYR